MIVPKAKKKENVQELTYLDHLEILRWKIISILCFFIVAFLVSFYYIDKVVFFLQAPIAHFKTHLYYFKPYEKFLAYVKLSFFLGIFISMPFALFQLSSFISPALKKEEKKYLYLCVLVVPIIFIVGAFFAYKLMAPTAMAFFLTFSQGDGVQPFWSFGEYFDLLMCLMLLMGIVFQAPLILLILIKIGIIDVTTLIKFRKHIIVLIVLIAGIVTPTPDVVSQIIVAIPLYLLFEITIIIGKLMGKNKPTTDLVEITEEE